MGERGGVKNMFDQLTLQNKIQTIKNKWKEEPVKESTLWWRWRTDMSLLKMLENKIKTAQIPLNNETI